MTAFPFPQPQPFQILDSDFVKIDALGVVFEVPVAGFNWFAASADGDFGSGVVEIKRVYAGGIPIDYSPAKTLSGAGAFIEPIDVSGISKIIFEVTTAQADGHIIIHTIAERF